MLKKTLRSLSSVKLAIFLFILLASASVLGTLIPQQRSAEQYAVQYGILAPLLIRLQFTNLYHSVWFVFLLSLFSLNTIVCTLTRLPQKWKKAFRPQVVSERKFLQAMKAKERWEKNITPAETVAVLNQSLKTHRYKVRKAAVDNGIHLLARKRTAGLFGSDLVHAGLLVILAGGILSGFTGYRTEIPLSEGEIHVVPRSTFSIRLDDFSTEYYPGGAVKDWKSTVSVLENAETVLTKTIEVNYPLSYKGFSFYQMSYGFNWSQPRLEILAKKNSDPSFNQILDIRVGERMALNDAEQTEIGIRRFLPDFVIDERNEPQTRSYRPNNPAAFIEGWRENAKIFEGWIFANYPDFSQIHGGEETDMAFELKAFSAPQYSVLEAARDPGVPLIWIGCLLLMGGLALAFYWPPWEIRAVIEEEKGKSEIMAGGVAAKGRDRFQTEFASVINAARRRK